MRTSCGPFTETCYLNMMHQIIDLKTSIIINIKVILKFLDLLLKYQNPT